MKKQHLIVLITVSVLLIGGLYFVLSKKSNSLSQTTQKQQDVTTWKTYQNKEYGFSIKYPSHYVTEEDSISTSIQWKSKTLIVISSNMANTTKSEIGIPSVRVILKRQPVVASGKIFHNVVDFYKSGYPDLIIQGIPDPKGTVLSMNGKQVLTYRVPAGDVINVPEDVYFFVKNDIIYQFSFDASDQNEKAILESIAWQ